MCNYEKVSSYPQCISSNITLMRKLFHFNISVSYTLIKECVQCILLHGHCTNVSMLTSFKHQSV